MSTGMPEGDLLRPLGGVALQRCDQFVGRTENWLYEFLCHVPRYRPIVLCQKLINRSEFPRLEAWPINLWSPPRRVWRRLTMGRLYPADWWRFRRVAPKVLHSHFGTTAIEDYELCKRLQLPWVVSFYGADIYQFGQWQQHYVSLFEKCQRVLALGPRMKAELEKRGCLAEKVILCPLGVDAQALPLRTRELQSGKTLKVLFAGTFREKKGLEYVITAAGVLKRRGVAFELHLVGDAFPKEGDQQTKARVFGMINQLDLRDEVIHHSWLPHHKLIDLALDCHVFVGPSVTASDGDSEGTPFVLQQMMATGMPCVATLHSDTPFIYGDHANLLVPERDARAIADRLEGYVAKPQLLAAHGVALREQISRHFDVRKCAARLKEIYDQVV